MSFRMSERSLFFVISFETILTLAHCIAYVNKIVLNNGITYRMIFFTAVIYLFYLCRKYRHEKALK